MVIYLVTFIGTKLGTIIQNNNKNIVTFIGTKLGTMTYL